MELSRFTATDSFILRIFVEFYSCTLTNSSIIKNFPFLPSPCAVEKVLRESKSFQQDLMKRDSCPNLKLPCYFIVTEYGY